MCMVCNCSRYLNGISAKSELGMGPEQMLFSEASGSTRGLSQEAQSLSNLSRLPAVNKSWHNMTSSKVPPAPQPKSSANSSLLNYNSSQMRGLLGQDFGLMPETSQVNLTAMAASQQQQQQHSFLSNGYGGVEAVSVGRESEGQPLRHFFDDWPRSRADPSALAWGSDVEDSERTNARTGGGGGNSNNHSHAGGNGGGSGANSNSNSNSTHNNNNNTQLSISIPITAPSSDFPSQSSGGSPPRGKLTLSPLKLSMSRAGVEADPTSSYMGLGVGLGGADDHDVDVDDDLIRHRQTTWIPIAWDSQTTTHHHHHHIIPVGGPLAEVLHGGHGAVTAGSDVCKSSGLNLTCNEESWLDDDDEHRRNHKQQSPGHLASPIDVLHNSTFTSFSDSSTSTSSGSSPRTTLPQQENNNTNTNTNSSVVAPPSQDPNPPSPILTTEPAASPLA